MDIQFKNKTVLITGASKGIGHAIALKLVKCNAKVIAIGRDQSGLDTLNHPSITPIQLDISDWSKTEEIFNQLPPIDLLVNNAGIALLSPLIEITESDFTKTFDVNVKGMINITRLFIKQLLARNKNGAIVNMSSQASQAGLLNHAIYCASKGAVDAFTRQVAIEYGSHGIRCNAINPTVIMTAMGRLGWSDPNLAKPMIDKIPLKRFGEVEEVVDGVLFLLSDNASMINGICMPIDGGFLAG